MFQLDQELEDASEKVFELTAGMSYGDLLRYDEIEAATGIPRYFDKPRRRNPRWDLLTDKINRKLLNRRGIKWTTVTGEGFILTEPNKQVVWSADHRRKKADRQLARAEKEVRAPEQCTLTPFNQILRAKILLQMSEERQQIKNGRTTLRVTETLPRRPESAMG